MNNTTYVLILLALGIISCSTQQDYIIEKEEGAIYSLFIDNMARPYPPPPPPPKNGSKPQTINSDSLNQIAVKIVIDTLMFAMDREPILIKEFPGFQPMVDHVHNLSPKPIKQKFVKSMKGHFLIYGTSLEDFPGDYSQMVFMSRIAFNEDFNRAAVYAGHSTHPLASYLNLYLLEKKEGRWQIIFKKNVEAS